MAETLSRKKYIYILKTTLVQWNANYRHGHDRLVVGFTTTCAVSVYSH